MTDTRGFTTVEELAAALKGAGIDNAYVRACEMWATPGAMYVAGPLLAQLTEDREIEAAPLQSAYLRAYGKEWVDKSFYDTLRERVKKAEALLDEIEAWASFCVCVCDFGRKCPHQDLADILSKRLENAD